MSAGSVQAKSALEQTLSDGNFRMKESEALVRHLLSIGGTGMFSDQIYNDPDCSLILGEGKTFLPFPKLLIKMEGNHCHWNIATLYEKAIVTEIVIGYALSIHGLWFQHTWGMQQDTIVETTTINSSNIRVYFGAVLNNPKSFVECCAQNPPGSGKVRRLQN